MPQSSESNPVLALIDFETHTRGGHFGHWLKIFGTEFSKRFDSVIVITPEPDLTRNLFVSSPSGLPANIRFQALPKGRRPILNLLGKRKKTSPVEILRNIFPGDMQGKAVSFFMWGYDLIDGRTNASAQISLPWATLGSGSWLLRNHSNDAASRDRELLRLCESNASCRAMVTPDEFITSNKHSKLKWLRAFEDVSVEECPTAEIQELRKRANGRPVIGGFGMLNGIRCVNEILRMMEFQQDFFFLLAGKLDRNSIDPGLRDRMESLPSDRAMLVEGFLAETRLNSLIAESNIVFLDGLQYPVHSSIATKSMYFGKCLLTRKSNSWMFDTIQSLHSGFVYSSPDENFLNQLEAWRASGGPERAKNLIINEMSSRVLGKAFDDLTNLLIQSADHSNQVPASPKTASHIPR